MAARSARIDLSLNVLHLAGRADYRAARFADLMGVNPKTLQRYFQKTLRCSTQRFLDHLCQLEAENLALNKTRTKDMAYALGFTQPSYFCRKFKKAHEASVTQWKKLHAAQPKDPQVIHNSVPGR